MPTVALLLLSLLLPGVWAWLCWMALRKLWPVQDATPVRVADHARLPGSTDYEI